MRKAPLCCWRHTACSDAMGRGCISRTARATCRGAALKATDTWCLVRSVQLNPLVLEAHAGVHALLLAGEDWHEDGPDGADAEQGTPALDDEDEGAAEEPEEDAPAAAAAEAAAAPPAVPPIPAEVVLERPAGATPVTAPTDALGACPSLCSGSGLACEERVCGTFCRPAGFLVLFDSLTPHASLIPATGEAVLMCHAGCMRIFLQ